MKIIDFQRKGNVVRFYLGEETEEWGWTRPDYKDYSGCTPSWLRKQDTPWGDDWNDRPYEHNAGDVYPWFVKGHKDVAFDYDDIVLEPCNGAFNSDYSKEDMLLRKIPCIIVVTKEVREKYEIEYDWEMDSFEEAMKLEGIKKYYFGDEL